MIGRDTIGSRQRGLLACAGALALAASACGAGNTATKLRDEAPATAARAAAPMPSSAAPATSAPAAAPPAAPHTPTAEEIARAVALVDSPDRQAAIAAFQKIEGTSLPDAYLAYLFHATGNAAESARYLERARSNLPDTARSMARPGDGRSAVYERLRVLRLAIEESHLSGFSGAPPIACSVFAAHGRDALDAFGGMWGSTRDQHGGDMKQVCVRRFLVAAAPTKADRVMGALDDLSKAIGTVAPMPQGTMYLGMFVGAVDILRDAILAPELPPSALPRSLDAEVTRASKTDPAIRGRLGAYRAVEARATPILAEGICAVLASRGRAADPAACEAHAKEAATHALASWIGGVHYQP